ncbi:MAG: acyl-CoA synthetase [Actinomycetota bacterium]|uniref:Acyl-CoA synthetase n=1 Tax=Mycobacterium lentiflavum TaxID=141349 RepID=A0ABY3V024_MYCLN|nr:acyl-CoA synthetase [Mycobacterium lentiflavum]MEE3066153.1 acyl-CoA synthetase [Actinomycetota bacterium]ULP44304.1 acyl-CoA synthetase [Mycobacterium lentiflavum]
MEFNLAQVFSAVAAANPDRDCIVFGHRRFTFSQTNERARRLARALNSWGLGVRRERHELAPHESGQSHLGLYLANGNEYLEGMLGAYQARVAPFNVNYRYVAEELVYLLGNASAEAVMYQARFAPTLALALDQARDRLPSMRLIHVDDESGNDPLPSAVRYEDLLAAHAGGVTDEPLDLALSPDDLYVLYTGGTTGMPKAVLWRQHDIYMNAMGGRPPFGGDPVTSLDDIVERSRLGGPGSMTCAPLMHGAAQWAAFINLCGGRPFVMAPTTTHFDPAEAWALASRERVMSLSFVGDAFGRPLIDALESGDYDLSGLLILVTGGAALSAPLKQRFLDLLPQLTILDAGGSSESGNQMGQVSSRQQGGSGRFAPNPGAVVVSEDMTRILSPGDDEIGWLAQQGLIPLGYLGDPEKTARTFPVIDGIRHSVPGDRARWFADGEIELLGRDSVTINSGGEKIFAEEVEAAIAEHPSVYDVVVTGRPSTRWGNEVVAIVALAGGEQASRQEMADSIIAEAARHIARYKLPKAIVFRDRLQRSPSGKADYRWAKAQAAQDV